MTPTETTATRPACQRLVIRVSRHSLSFSAQNSPLSPEPPDFEPYPLKSGISPAANLREAFKTARLPAAGCPRVSVMVESPVLMVPVGLYDEGRRQELYRHSYPDTDAERVEGTVLPDLNAVALYAVNKDLQMVVTDRFANAQFMCALAPVWRHLYQRSFASQRNKVYTYFHDDKMDVMSFAQNRFKFCNAFPLSHTPEGTASAHDALYYMLYVWKQLMLNAERDELYLVGELPERDWLVSELHRYVQRVYVINPSSDFNRAPATRVAGMPFDMMAFYAKGR